jgi:hypothetical protein
MAITIAIRPRTVAYYNDASPPVPVYSNWNAAWNPIVYEFAVPTNNDRKSALIVNIYEVGTNTLLASNTIRPFTTGNLKHDVGPYVRSYLFSRYQPDFTSGDNSKDNGNSIQFYITYTQKFENGHADIFNSDSARPIVASCSAMQFGDQNNGNMITYTPFNSDLDEESKMKFMTCFDRPIMWKGFPFTLSFIYPTDLISIQIYKKESQLNVNKQLLIADDINLDPTQVGFVNNLLINEPDETLAKFMKVALYTGEGIPNYYVDPGYVDEGYEQVL